MKKSKIFLVILLVISFSLVSYGAVVAKNTGQKFDPEKYKSMDDKQIVDSLKNLSKEELINEVNSITNTLQENDSQLIPFASAILQRKDEITDSDIINIIKDNVSSKTFKNMMVELYTIKNENKPEKQEMKKLLENKNIDKEIKAKIVANINFNSNDINLLKSFIQSDDGDLAFQSLKNLSKINAKEAFDISSIILQNRNSVSTEKKAAALKATSYYIKNNKSNIADNTKLKNNFINLSLEIIESNSEDNIVKDSAVFAISDLKSKEAVSKIMNNSKIDKELKEFAIDQNYMTLEKILSGNPNEEDIKTVVQAMEILPIVDLVDDLEKVSTKIKNTDLQQQCNAVINNMKSNGIKANQKWLKE